MRETATIKLLAPQNDSVTPPLQQWSLPEDWSGASVEPIRWNDLHVVSEDRSLPRVVLFAWEVRTRHEDSFSYELAISRNVNFDEPCILRNLSEPKAEVRHLHIATRYFWRVTAMCSGRRVVVSPVWSFATNSTPPRWIAVPGITNVRDIGGWPLPRNRMVNQGVIYRGSEMNDHIDITEDGKEILIHELGIRTDLDLRGNPEATPALDSRIVRWINIPVMPYKSICEETSKKSYCRIFETFADASNYPILFHCWGGADRGGTLSFLLGALLGMSMDDLIRDYELTSLSIWGVRYRESDEFKGLLDVLARFGNGKDDINEQVESYLRDAGLTEKHIALIRTQCVVPALGHESA
ncbi:MAG: tyrosine-protein phosphatase [Candidatus Latescibacteria bacterium]|nr:tyrosine-protein phosphatase [Candidatus Latescibacterota bacterium]